jgi:hypothetical protein
MRFFNGCRVESRPRGAFRAVHAPVATLWKLQAAAKNRRCSTATALLCRIAASVPGLLMAVLDCSSAHGPKFPVREPSCPPFRYLFVYIDRPKGEHRVNQDERTSMPKLFAIKIESINQRITRMLLKW